MGIAYAAGMVLIYLLVVAQFRSYLVPLVIMAPIPLTVIGVMPRHALLVKNADGVWLGRGRCNAAIVAGRTAAAAGGAL